MILPPYSSGKCHAILSCVGGIAATVVAEAGPRLWNQWEVGHLWEKGIDVQTMRREIDCECNTIKHGSKKPHSTVNFQWKRTEQIYLVVLMHSLTVFFNMYWQWQHHGRGFEPPAQIIPTVFLALLKPKTLYWTAAPHVCCCCCLQATDWIWLLCHVACASS